MRALAASAGIVPATRRREQAMPRLHARVAVLAASAALAVACGAPAARTPAASDPSSSGAAPAAVAGAAAASPASTSAAPGAQAAAAASAPGPLKKLLFPCSPVEASSTPLWLAVEEKLFEKQGLEVELQSVGGSSAILQAMTGGQFDLGGVGGGDVAPIRASGGDVTMVGVYMGLFSIEGVTLPEIRQVADLRGKNIAVTRLGSSTHFAAIAMLASGGLRPDDAVYIQSGGVAASMAALTTGNADGAMLGFPSNLEAKKAGYRTLINFQELGDYALFPQNAIAVRQSWLQEPANRAAALQFLRALTESLSLAKAGGPEARAAVRKYTQVEDAAVLQSTVDFYREFFPDTLRVPEKSISNMLQFVGLDHPEVAALDPRTLYDNSLVDQVLHESGR
jgi:NitT/TauT family transport system substrate-binding protein